MVCKVGDRAAHSSARPAAPPPGPAYPRAGAIRPQQPAIAKPDYRVEHDSMGELQVPADALWGAQTQRAVDNFPISGRPMPRGFIRALGLVKAAAASVNADLGLLPKGRAGAIAKAARAVADGTHD